MLWPRCWMLVPSASKRPQAWQMPLSSLQQHPIRQPGRWTFWQRTWAMVAPLRRRTLSCRHALGGNEFQRLSTVQLAATLFISVAVLTNDKELIH